MTVIKEIEQMLWLDTPHGVSLALFMIDYGPQQNVVFVTVNEQNGMIKHYDSEQVRVVTNYTFDINKPKRDELQ